MRTTELLLADGKALLLTEITTGEQSELTAAFCAWLGVGGRDLEDFAVVASTKEGAQQTYQVVATLGLAADAGVLSPTDVSVLKAGLRRLAGREVVIDGVPAPVCMDAVGVLGITLGAKAVAPSTLSDDVRSWLNRFLRSSYGLERTHDWQRSLFALSGQLLGGESSMAVPLDASTADVRVALRSKGLIAAISPTQAENDDVEVLSLVIRETMPGLGCLRAALRLAALEWVRRSAPVLTPSRVSVEQLVELLKRVPAGLRRWTWETIPRTRNAVAQQWRIENEYHVQNLLYFLLSPQFPDLTDEGYLPQVGQKNPRADLLIPSMKTIIEVKFLRATVSFADLIEEVAADNSLYLAKDSPYTTIIPFVWDDSSRSTQYDYFIQGVKKLTGVPDAIVISKPGHMSFVGPPTGRTEPAWGKTGAAGGKTGAES